MSLNATLLGAFMIGWFCFYLVVLFLLNKHHDMSPPLKLLGLTLWIVPPVGLVFLILVGIFVKRKEAH